MNPDLSGLIDFWFHHGFTTSFCIFTPGQPKYSMPQYVFILPYALCLITITSCYYYMVIPPPTTTTNYDMIWCDMIWYGMIWYDTHIYIYIYIYMCDASKTMVSYPLWVSLDTHTAPSQASGDATGGAFRSQAPQRPAAGEAAGSAGEASGWPEERTWDLISGKTMENPLDFTGIWPWYTC